MKSVMFVVVSIVLMIGCQSGVGTVKGGRDVITEEEIRNSNETNLYDVIRKLRPMFLTSRGPKSLRLEESTLPLVYLDGTKYGEAESLRTMPIVGVQEIRFLDARDATTMYGTGHTSGIIMVITKK
ncbi:MAG TPA: hypothetical protein VNN76_12885 [Bacteroidota bacterium]|nr:hypothetical protein [Bacteroidota bacterium]